MYFTPINIREYIEEECTRFAKLFSDSYSGIYIKTKSNSCETTIKFCRYCNSFEYAFVIGNDSVVFLEREYSFPFYKTKKSSKTIIAEWNAFADPFEAALVIQMKMYNILKSNIMKENSFKCVFEDYTSDDDEYFNMTDDTENTDSTADDEDFDIFSISDLPEENAIIGSQRHDYKRHDDKNSYTTETTSDNNIAAFSEVCEESYLDIFDTI